MALVASLEIRDLSIRYSTRQVGDREMALLGVSFSVAPGEIVAVIGPSGCGKTTLLRAIAGLERPSHGGVYLESKEVSEGDALMLFQESVLYSHLDVAGNVAFGLRLRGVSTKKALSSIEPILKELGLSELRNRQVDQLSGGERRRVDLGRVLACDPSLILLDEPLSHVDSRASEQLRGSILKALRSRRTAALWVTHQPDEAMGVADRIVVLSEGRLLEDGPCREVYLKPQTLEGARTLGRASINAFDYAELTDALSEAEKKMIPNSWWTPNRGDDSSESLVLACRPEHVQVRLMEEEPNDLADGLRGRIVARRFLGDSERIEIEGPGGVWTSLRPCETPSIVPERGERCVFRVPPQNVMWFEATTGRRVN